MYNVDRSQGGVRVVTPDGKLVFRGGTDTYVLHVVASQTYATMVKEFKSDAELLVALSKRILIPEAQPES